MARGPGIDGQLASITTHDSTAQFTTQPRKHVSSDLEVDDPPATAGESVTVDGDVYLARGQQFAGRPTVRLQTRPSGSPSWTTVSQFTVPDPPGFFDSFTAPSAPGRYQVRVVVLGDSYVLKTLGDPVPLTVVAAGS